MKNHVADPSQSVIAISCSVTDENQMKTTLVKAEALIGKKVDYVFACAGASVPRLFKDQPASEFCDLMNLNYNGTINTIKVRKPLGIH
jgi:NAD(P)-dependent dehydrogenase (short-subunit alcohol dehydrogenase family)